MAWRGGLPSNSTLWTWLAIGSSTLVSYDQARDAHQRAAWRRGLALGAMLLAGMGAYLALNVELGRREMAI